MKQHNDVILNRPKIQSDHDSAAATVVIQMIVKCVTTDEDTFCTFCSWQLLANCPRPVHHEGTGWPNLDVGTGAYRRRRTTPLPAMANAMFKKVTRPPFDLLIFTKQRGTQTIGTKTLIPKKCGNQSGGSRRCRPEVDRDRTTTEATSFEAECGNQTTLHHKTTGNRHDHVYDKTRT